MSILSIDIETKSPVDLEKSGIYRYMENLDTDVLVAAFSIDDDVVGVWFPGDPCPERVARYILSDGLVAGWNVNFERQAFNRILGPRYGWPVPQLHQFRDTAAQAAAQALPRSLEKAAEVLRVVEQKDVEGSRLMLKMSKPRKPRPGENPEELHWEEGDLYRLAEYCCNDVLAERAIRKRLQPLSESEQRLWVLDQTINDRGIVLDQDLVRAMSEIVEDCLFELDEDMWRLTEGAIEKCSQTERLKRWLDWNGLAVDSLAKDVIDEVLAQDMPDKCRQALEIWTEASKASVRKLKAATLCVNGDDRARGMLLFHGATSGRWSGKLWQPQNLPRSTKGFDQDTAITEILNDTVNGNPLPVISNALRGVMTAGPGKMLMAGDYKNVESRITAWVAGYERKLDQFRAQDAGTGPEVYALAASQIYNVPVSDITETDPRRQTGKTAELALGFGGGVAALAKMSRGYHVDMADAWKPLWESAHADDRRLCLERHAEVFAKGNGEGLGEKAWQACWLTVRAWRAANGPIVQMWHDMNSAAWHTLAEPGAEITVGKTSFKLEKGFLWLTLPSGRRLAYPTPARENREVPWSDKTLPKNEREHKDMLTVLAFEGKHAIRYPFYPGLTFQHSVQAIARDLLANGMLEAERQGFPVVMSIHDEVIAEVHDGNVNLPRFLKALCVLPDWAKGLPLLADGWSGFRYRKV